MARISGVTLKDNQQIRFALSLIKGVGKSNVKIILADLKISPIVLVKDLTEEQTVAITNKLNGDYLIEEDLFRQQKENIARHIRIATFRGLRHKAGLPVRGQTTKTNSRTVRGNVRKTAGSGRVKAEGKT